MSTFSDQNYIFDSGILNLDSLYEFSKNDLENDALNGQSKAGRAFGKLVSKIADSVSENGGFYIWGNYSTNKLWNNIYIGKAGFGKTTRLKKRISEELKDERVIFWTSKLNDNEIIDICKSIYTNKDYTNNWKRSFKKINSRLIIWIAINPSEAENFEKEIEKIESDIIETMNPTANTSRPKPFGELQHSTIEIIKRMKHLIHENRNK